MMTAAFRRESCGRWGALLFPVVLGVSVAHASLGPLKLDEVVESVRAKYPLVEAALQDVESARGEGVSSRGAFDLTLKSRASWDLESYYRSQTFDAVLEQATPVWGLSLFGGYRRGLGSFPVYDGKLQTLDGGEWRAGVSLPLLRDGATDATRARVARADLGVEVANAALQQQFVESVRSARQRYWEWVAAGGKMKVARQILEIAEKRDLQLRVQQKKGDVSIFDVNDNFRGVVQRRSQVESAERAIRRAELELGLFFRDSSSNPVVPDRARIPEGFPNPEDERSKSDAEWDGLIQQAQTRRPDLNRLQGQRAQNDQERFLAENQLFPKVDLSLTMSKDLGSGGVELSKPETEASVVIEIPIPFRGARGRVQSANALDSKIASQARLTSDRIATEIRDSRSALLQALNRVRLAEQEVELAQGLEQGERARFAHGDSNLIFVQLREQTTADAATRRIDALLDYWAARAAFEAAQGLPVLE